MKNLMKQSQNSFQITKVNNKFAKPRVIKKAMVGKSAEFKSLNDMSNGHIKIQDSSEELNSSLQRSHLHNRNDEYSES